MRCTNCGGLLFEEPKTTGDHKCVCTCPSFGNATFIPNVNISVGNKKKGSATDDFKIYLNEIMGKIDDNIHNELWNKLIAVITEKETEKP